MNLDWKDVLGSLKTSGTLPVDDTPDIPADDMITEKETQKQKLRVVTDRKGRKGKTATIVEGFTCPDAEVEEVAKKLKQRLGTGGSARGGEILIQGDRKGDVIKALTDLGYKAIPV